MSSCLIDLHYLPSISYFIEICKHENVILNDTENFQKQTYRNRSVILGANGTLNLTVPVNHKSQRKISKLEISYTDNWHSVHSKSIESAYRRSPFYDYYSEEILSCIQSKPVTLWDLNYAILTTLIDLTGIGCKIRKKSDLKENEIISAINLSNKIKPKKPEIKHITPEYQQVFGTEFTQDLSIIDLLFCLGPETITYLER